MRDHRGRLEGGDYVYHVLPHASIQTLRLGPLGVAFCRPLVLQLCFHHQSTTEHGMPFSLQEKGRSVFRVKATIRIIPLGPKGRPCKLIEKTNDTIMKIHIQYCAC